jgi:hypothetical protein
MVSLIATSFFLKQPTFIWDKDGDDVYNWSDVCPDKPGLAKFDGCSQKTKEPKKKNLKQNNVDAKDETPSNETISNQKNAIWNNLNAGQEIHLTRDKNADLFQLLRKGVIFLKYENNKFWFDVRTAGKSKWIELENENTEKIRVFFNIELDDINPQNNNNIKETTKVSSNPTSGGTNRTGGTNTNTNTSSGSKETTQTSTKKEYPNIAKAKSTFSNWEKEENPKKKVEFKNVFLGFKEAYFGGVTSGKYAEDKDFEKFLKSSMKKL